MKTYKGNSPVEMQSELSHEKQNAAFLFSVIVDQGDSRSNVAKEVPFQSDRDFNIHQLDQAAPFVFGRLADSPGKLRSVDSAEVQGCGRPRGFLSSVADLVDEELAGDRAPGALCYLYNGQRYTLKVTQSRRPVAQESVQLSLHDKGHRYIRSYRDLLRVRFDNLNEMTGKRTPTLSYYWGPAESCVACPCASATSPTGGFRWC